MELIPTIGNVEEEELQEPMTPGKLKKGNLLTSTVKFL